MGGTIDDDISVERDALRLLAFSWQGVRYPVTTYQVVGTPPTRWWDGQGERTYVRVSAHGSIYELYFDHQRQTWVLSRRLS
jgi:hypothetical protein